jgi:predicted amidophosphoribosyltransferase
MSEDPPAYGDMRILAARPYRDGASKMVWGAKYSGKPRDGFLDAEEAIRDFVQYLPALGDVDLVTPVPGRIGGKTHELAPRLAVIVADTLGVLIGNLLERTRKAPPMRRMGREERARHVAGLYRLKRGAAVKGKRILVVDDVSTTGATLRECRRVLLDAGAKSVVGLVLAKVTKKKGGAPVPPKVKKKRAKKKPKTATAPKPKAPDLRAGASGLYSVDMRFEKVANARGTERVLRAYVQPRGPISSLYVAVPLVPPPGAWLHVKLWATTAKEATDVVASMFAQKPRKRRGRRF